MTALIKDQDLKLGLKLLSNAAPVGGEPHDSMKKN
jgi:hypothetical protein